jgi:hypothetical protein
MNQPRSKDVEVVRFIAGADCAGERFHCDNKTEPYVHCDSALDREEQLGLKPDCALASVL